ncbi:MULTISPECIES: GTP 3',8-cyclase MoaA [Actinomycetaceae]|uniref:GTP 3',8-cyclase MoaA n=1 Tax=Actinomycetaceae TaxID=2049 RepID=UPI00050E4287|nr:MULTISPECIES: GTP 3',8-cyclase MoaA [Actinomycetaceae]KGF02667.1 molybdenum cofactor biosynthesis protein MoeA [Actinomyces sp. S4-C9]
MQSNTQLGVLTDRFGRVASDLRVSLTDRCNLRCEYCMPAEGLEWLPTENTLSDEEILRLIRIGIELLGIEQVRFTGGEPLLRRSLEQIVSQTKAMTTHLGAPPQISITSNGLGLDKRAEALFKAGVSRANISLDSLDQQRYAAIARRDRLADALRGIEAADRAGMSPIKINAVAMKGINEDDIVKLLAFCLDHGYHLRFIEHMPLGPAHSWKRDQLLTQADILEWISKKFELTPSSKPRGSAPAELWNVAASADHPAGDVGVIASVTNPFCDDCDRTRITADGQIRTCLFATTETDLRGPLRAGASDEELANIWMGATEQKQAGHGMGRPDFQPPKRTMSRIGG